MPTTTVICRLRPAPPTTELHIVCDGLSLSVCSRRLTVICGLLCTRAIASVCLCGSTRSGWTLSMRINSNSMCVLYERRVKHLLAQNRTHQRQRLRVNKMVFVRPRMDGREPTTLLSLIFIHRFCDVESRQRIQPHRCSLHGIEIDSVAYNRHYRLDIWQQMPLARPITFSITYYYATRCRRSMY